jgi:hypothetical protein
MARHPDDMSGKAEIEGDAALRRLCASCRDPACQVVSRRDTFLWLLDIVASSFKKQPTRTMCKTMSAGKFV